MEITLEYKYLGIDFYSHGYFEPSSKRWRIVGTKALMDILRKEPMEGATCWVLKSHLFKALVLPTFTYGIIMWECDLKNSHWKAFEKGTKMQMISHVKLCSTTTYHILSAKFGNFPIELHAFKFTIGFQQWLAHLSPSWLVKKAHSFFLTPSTNHQSCGRHHDVYLTGTPMTTQPHNFKKKKISKRFSC